MAKFVSKFTVFCEPEMIDSLNAAAERQLLSLSSYVRRALAAKLARDGLPAPANRPAHKCAPHKRGSEKRNVQRRAA